MQQRPHSHSWSWIAARLSPKRIWSNNNPTPQRPALASIEALGDRILLSANSEGGGPPIGDSAILAAVIKGQLPLITAEQDLMKLAGSGLTDKTKDDFKKLTEAFLKVDETVTEAASDTFAKLGDIKGESLDHKHKDEIQVLSDSFQKIDLALTNLGLKADENGQLPAVQFEGHAMDLLKLVQSGVGGDLDHKTEDFYARINDQFWKFDQQIIKVQSDLIAVRKAGKGQQEFLVIKMNDVLISSIQQVTDPNLKDQLLTVEGQTFAILDGLLKTDTGDGGGDGGGGDVIG